MHNKIKHIALVIGVMLLTILLDLYFYMPAINLHSVQFCFHLIFFLLEFMLLVELPKKLRTEKETVFFDRGSGKVHFNYQAAKSKFSKVILGLIALIMIYFGVSQLLFSPLFMADRYAKRIEIENVDFSEVPPYTYNQTAIIDRLSAMKLGDKVMGEVTDLISQFSVSNEYSQISYKGGTYRVTPLAYEGFIKYLRNRGEGIPAYIIVNTTSGETKLQRLDKKMRYVPSAMFHENLYRRLRFKYPTVIFNDPTFEVDEEGNPYYVCTTYSYLGAGTLRRVTGVIIFNPVDGSSEKYDIENAPQWVDRIYPEDLIIQELDNYGMFQKGFFNSVLGQSGVKKTSEGYNYIAKGDDIWLYTGMTSVVSDESNIGFALVNLRTHQAQFIKTSGADEYSVMRSAEGEVLNFGYQATFPTLININDRPFYLLSLKDSAGLVKMYAMVDARDYQQVYTVKADRSSKEAINILLSNAGAKKQQNPTDHPGTDITIDSLATTVIDGNTYVYIKSGKEVYKLPITEENAEVTLFLTKDNHLKIRFNDEDGKKIIYDVEVVK